MKYLRADVILETTERKTKNVGWILLTNLYLKSYLLAYLETHSDLPWGSQEHSPVCLRFSQKQ